VATVAGRHQQDHIGEKNKNDYHYHVDQLTESRGVVIPLHDLAPAQLTLKGEQAQAPQDRLLRIRHTCAYILAMAVQRLYPGTQVAIGPWTETGFFYDLDVPVSLTESDLPKINLKIRDAIGRLWQYSTIQIDFNLPERFGLSYVAQDGSRQVLIMIHRAIFGSLERLFGVLIENYAGDFPLWLSPLQMRLCPVTQAQQEYAEQIAHLFQEIGYRVDTDHSGERLGKQIRNADQERIPVIVVVGKQEIQNQTLSVRTRGQGDLGSLPVKQVKELLWEAIQSRVVL